MNEPFIQLYRRDSHGNWTGNSTEDFSPRKFIEELILENSLQTRTTVIILASFNIAAAAIMLISIVYDSWLVSRRRRLLPLHSPSRLEFLRKIHPVELTPLALSTGIVMQGSIFIGVQATGLHSLFVHDCGALSQIIWPAIWIVAYILLVFSVEVAWRGFQKRRFAACGRWNASICWVIVVIMLVLTWIPSRLRPFTMEKCVASLIWWAAPWSDIGVFIASVLIGLYTITAFAIAYQLFRTPNLGREERIAASRTVYYLAVGIIMLALMLPFFVSTYRRSHGMLTSRMAGIVLNLFGLVMGFLHLMLRLNAELMAIRPLGAPWAKTKSFTCFGYSDLNIGAQMEMPVAIERSMSTRGLARTPSEKYRGLLSPDSLQPTIDIRSPRAAKSPLGSPMPPKADSTTGLVCKKSNGYSVFPINSPQEKTPTSRAVDSGEDDLILLPPPPLFLRRHQRDSSNISSATVQIGLRLSHYIIPARTDYLETPGFQLPIQSPNSPRSSLSRRPGPSPLSQESLNRESSTKSMELPIQFKPPTPSPQQSPQFSPLRSPLLQHPSPMNSPQVPASPWPQRSASLKNRRNGAQILQNSGGDYRMKTLPPIPGRPISEVITISDQNSTHSSLPRRSFSNPSPGHRRPSAKHQSQLPHLPHSIY